MDELITWRNKVTGKEKTLSFAHMSIILKNYKGKDLECLTDGYVIKGNELIKQAPKKKKKKTKDSEKDK